MWPCSVESVGILQKLKSSSKSRNSICFGYITIFNAYQNSHQPKTRTTCGYYISILPRIICMISFSSQFRIGLRIIPKIFQSVFLYHFSNFCICVGFGRVCRSWCRGYTHISIRRTTATQ